MALRSNSQQDNLLQNTPVRRLPKHLHSAHRMPPRATASKLTPLGYQVQNRSESALGTQKKVGTAGGFPVKVRAVQL